MKKCLITSGRLQLLVLSQRRAPAPAWSHPPHCRLAAYLPAANNNQHIQRPFKEQPGHPRLTNVLRVPGWINKLVLIKSSGYCFTRSYIHTTKNTDCAGEALTNCTNLKPDRTNLLIWREIQSEILRPTARSLTNCPLHFLSGQGMVRQDFTVMKIARWRMPTKSVAAFHQVLTLWWALATRGQQHLVGNISLAATRRQKGNLLSLWNTHVFRLSTKYFQRGKLRQEATKDRFSDLIQNKRLQRKFGVDRQIWKTGSNLLCLLISPQKRIDKHQVLGVSCTNIPPLLPSLWNKFSQDVHLSVEIALSK